SKEPKDSLHHLRSVTLKFSNFPSLKRFTPNRSKCEIAIDLFLGNPILLYAHHDFFENGIDAFNKIAKIVNDIEPNIQWRSLGYITRRLYLQRLREDGNYDVLAFTNNFVIENSHGRDVIYVVRKEEAFSPPIKELTVNGQPYPYDRSGNGIILKIPVPEGESRHLIIKYENDLDLTCIDISKKDLRVNLLRKLSDFRDMNLSTYALGRVFIFFYYGMYLYKLGLKHSALVLSLIFVILMYFCLYLRKRIKT
ncbi:MAG: hypothetical protein ACFFDT_31585, partial [Candidatus Hodarchaeota archaeon]